MAYSQISNQYIVFIITIIPLIKIQLYPISIVAYITTLLYAHTTRHKVPASTKHLLYLLTYRKCLNLHNLFLFLLLNVGLCIHLLVIFLNGSYDSDQIDLRRSLPSHNNCI